MTQYRAYKSPKSFTEVIDLTESICMVISRRRMCLDAKLRKCLLKIDRKIHLRDVERELHAHKVNKHYIREYMMYASALFDDRKRHVNHALRF